MRTSVPPQIVDEASDWFVQMRESSVSEEHRAAFAEWLRVSPVHVGAYLDVVRLWADAGHLDPALIADPTADPPTNVVRLRNPSPAAVSDASVGEVEVASSRRQRPGRTGDAKAASAVVARNGRAAFGRTRFFKNIALAASIAGLCVVSSIVWWQASRETTYATGIGEQRVLTLEDGSIVKMNSRSKFKVRLSTQQRRIEMVEGQALFAVAHDSARPFIVTGGEVAIRAVGTQFDVNRRRSGMVVTVVEGRVKVGPAAPSGLFGSAQSVKDEATQPGSSGVGQAAIFLSAGEQARVSTSGAIKRTADANTAAAVSWLQAELIFDGQSLADVLEEFNRYSRVPIVLTDPSLGELRINAVFHTTASDSLIRFLSRLEGVQIEGESGKEIRISRRKAGDQLTLRLDPPNS